MEDLSLHILDIVENSVRAGCTKVVIELIEDESTGKMTLSIEDDGKGIDKETVEKIMDPFYTTKEGKDFGLGLSLLCQSAHEADGEMVIESEEGKGTKVTATFDSNHPDMRPMGDISATMAALIAGNPSVQFVLDYKMEGQSYHFDSFG